MREYPIRISIGKLKHNIMLCNPSSQSSCLQPRWKCVWSGSHIIIKFTRRTASTELPNKEATRSGIQYLRFITFSTFSYFSCNKWKLKIIRRHAYEKSVISAQWLWNTLIHTANIFFHIPTYFKQLTLISLKLKVEISLFNLVCYNQG